eukprot:6127118-Prymnesium_polylepis.1
MRSPTPLDPLPRAPCTRPRAKRIDSLRDHHHASGQPQSKGRMSPLAEPYIIDTDSSPAATRKSL